MSSKSQNLINLFERLNHFVIPKLMVYKVSSKQSVNDFVASVNREFSGQRICVRSAAADEDNQHQSGAGKYDSVLNIHADDPELVLSAINQVIQSYGRNISHEYQDEVIVQYMLENTVMSGVVFTHDLNTGAPYYVINYDDVSGLTNTVTSGGGEYANRTLYVHRDALNSLRSERFQHLLEAVRELEKIMGSQFLDIEFALAEDLTPYLLQVRAITTQPNWNRAVARRINEALKGIQSFVSERFKPVTGVYGNTTVLGQMPDWNPAEMIGRAPRALAYSLYRMLITDHAWRIARKRMGYGAGRAAADGLPCRATFH
jgi:phosphoenolpyruvate synthase/pyruvate phosphate dikinase